MSLRILLVLSWIKLATSRPSKDGFQTLATIDIRVSPTSGSVPSLSQHLLNHTLATSRSEDDGEWGPEMPDASPEMYLLAETLEEVKNIKDQQGENLDQIRKLFEEINAKLSGDRRTVGQCNPAQSPDTECTKEIIAGTEWPSPKWFSPKNVLIDSCDDSGDGHAMGAVYWWAAPDKATGNSGYFTMDLGCSKCISKVVVRNSGNGSAKSRGTKEFLISVATELQPTEFEPVVKGYLEDVRNVPCHSQPGKKTFVFAPREARYVKFEAVSYYGAGPVLQYFDAN